MSTKKKTQPNGANLKKKSALYKQINNKDVYLKSETNMVAPVISNPGIPGEKSLNVKQISPRILVEMTVAGFVITSLCPNFFGWELEMTTPIIK